MEHLNASGIRTPRLGEDRGVGLVAAWAAEPEAEADPSRRLEPGVHHVVAVADEGDLEVAEVVAAVLAQRLQVGEHLAGVAQVGQSVDDRDRRVAREFDERRVREGPRDDQVHPARQVARKVGDGLAFAEPDVLVREVD